MNGKLLQLVERKARGSALLIAILVMGVLMMLTLGLSDLVIREIRQTTDVVTEGKAYFAAEAGVENALLDLHENLPGFERSQEVKCGDATSNLNCNNPGEADFHYRYTISNTADKVPFYDPNKAVFLNPKGTKVVDGNSPGAMSVSSNTIYTDFPAATYNVLPLHESVVIPLSSDALGQGTPQDVQDFLVQYYFNFDKSNAKVTNGDLVKNLDMLRWKIFGHPKTGNGFDALKTDAISDLYPALLDNTPEQPVCIGTDQTMSAANGQTPCVPLLSQGMVWGAARECYLSDSSSVDADSSSLNDIQTAEEGGCTIKNFIQHHTQNFLVLTNYLIPETIGLGSNPTDSGTTNIYYRVIAKSGEGQSPLVREAASISAQGLAGKDQFQQSIDVNIGLSSFLPVFNFSLYRTDSSKPKIDFQLPDLNIFNP